MQEKNFLILMLSFAKYSQVFKNSWQQNFEYRLFTFLRIIITLISLISIFFLWNDLYGTKTNFNGYTKPQMLSYYILVGYIFSSISSRLLVSKDIQDGSLSIYIVRPINYLISQYFESLADRLLRLLLGLPIIIGIFIIFHNQLFIPTNPLSYLYFAITLFSALNLLFLIDIMLNMLEFWMYQSNATTMITDGIIAFFSGTLIPIFLLPEMIQTIGNYLPFKYTNFFPVDSLIKNFSFNQMITGIVVQLFWTVILALLALIIWNRGMKKYEAVGG